MWPFKNVSDSLLLPRSGHALCSSFLQVAPEGAAGLSLRLDGFSHKLPALAEAVFTTLATLKVLALQL
jgi:secreted Zn-dependent insulinase-like peptidase